LIDDLPDVTQAVTALGVAELAGTLLVLHVLRDLLDRRALPGPGNLVEELLPGEAETVTDGQWVARLFLVNPHGEFALCENVYAVEVGHRAVSDPAEMVSDGGLKPLHRFRAQQALERDDVNGFASFTATGTTS